MGISKRVRFEVFKRDAFTCQYCGSKAPEVRLEVDHIKPKSKGGSNDLLNLITSCPECNRGKSDVKLDDNSAVIKRQQQAEELQTRRQQLEMMMEWHDSLNELENDKVHLAVKKFDSELYGLCLNEYGIEKMRKHIKRFGLQVVLDAIEIACESYLEGEVDDDGNYKTKNSSVVVAVSKIAGIAYNLKHPEKTPPKMVYTIRKTLMNRRIRVNQSEFFSKMKPLHDSDLLLESLFEYAKVANSWSQFENGLDSVLQFHHGTYDEVDF